MQDMKKSVQFYAVQFELPDAQGVALGDLPLVQPPFILHLDHLCLSDEIKKFQGVIGQDRELIHTGDFVLLSSVHYEEVNFFVM